MVTRYQEAGSGGKGDRRVRDGGWRAAERRG
ncbi:hypothetical protein V6Z12_D01G157400 [Gossypium hirsutum]